MRKIITLFIIFITIFASFWTINTYATLVGGSETAKINYCDWEPCWLMAWVDMVKKWIKGVPVEWKASDHIQWIVKYLLWYITLIAVIFIIYAWFKILISSWDEEKIKSSKKIIIYVIVWILVIWFAWSIAYFAVDLWNKTK